MACASNVGVSTVAAAALSDCRRWQRVVSSPCGAAGGTSGGGSSSDMRPLVSQRVPGAICLAFGSRCQLRLSFGLSSRLAIIRLRWHPRADQGLKHYMHRKQVLSTSLDGAGAAGRQPCTAPDLASPHCTRPVPSRAAQAAVRQRVSRMPSLAGQAASGVGAACVRACSAGTPRSEVARRWRAAGRPRPARGAEP